MSRLPRLGTLARTFRRMHTDGRQIDHSGPTTSPPHQAPPPNPTDAAPLPQPSAQTAPVLPDSTDVTASVPRSTKKGRPIFNRPPRTVPVTLPSGYPEPSMYPPPKEYFESLDEKRKNPHPLWKFFHVPVSENVGLRPGQGLGQPYISLETLSSGDANLHSGRSWTAEELRQKSFKDLHILWYVLLRERNVLATQAEERRRLGLTNGDDSILNEKRVLRCRKSLIRIKYVLNERRLGLIAAAGPHLVSQTEDGRVVPMPIAHVSWSATGTTDPAGATHAIRGVAPKSKRVRNFMPEASVGRKEESFLDEEYVSVEEIQARDEGFGGGKEAEKFDKEVVIEKDGKVEKKE